MYIAKFNVDHRAKAALELVGNSDILNEILSTLPDLSNVDQRTLWCIDIAITKVLVEYWLTCNETDSHVAMQRMLDEQTKGFESFYPKDAKFNVSNYNDW